MKRPLISPSPDDVQHKNFGEDHANDVPIINQRSRVGNNQQENNCKGNENVQRNKRPTISASFEPEDEQIGDSDEDRPVDPNPVNFNQRNRLANNQRGIGREGNKNMQRNKRPRISASFEPEDEQIGDSDEDRPVDPNPVNFNQGNRLANNQRGNGREGNKNIQRNKRPRISASFEPEDERNGDSDEDQPVRRNPVNANQRNRFADDQQENFRNGNDNHDPDDGIIIRILV